MRVYDNGKYREMTAAEMQEVADTPAVVSEITTEQRIEALEAAMLEMAEVILNG